MQPNLCKNLSWLVEQENCARTKLPVEESVVEKFMGEKYVQRRVFLGPPQSVG